MNNYFLRSVWIAAALFSGSIAVAEKAPVYISPNNDGVQDFLEVPLQIKEKRYISEWSFIVTNDKGQIVRTIGNKEKRPDKITVKNFFKELVTPKTGVVVPKSVVWNGVMDSGETAPDGVYYYSFTAADDNGNKAATEKLSVIVDCTAPDVTVTQPAETDKIFGEGNKAVLTVRQIGSVEDLWTGVFSDAAGKAVRTFKWTQGEPLKFDWDGTDDHGIPVSDGVYSYKIAATDRAGNHSAPAGIKGIIYSAEKPATNIGINGSRYFSPDGNGVLDTIAFDVLIPVPDASKGTGNKLISWAVKITGTDGKVYRTFSGSGDPPKAIVFDGKSDSGTVLPEGSYQARVMAGYLNGFEPYPVNSPVFMLDVTAPQAVVRLSNTTFSPDGDGNLDTLTISQQTAADSGSPVRNWSGSILDRSGTVIREYSFGEFPPQTVVWDGIDGNGKLAADGSYTYVLTASDLAGNAAKITSSPVAVDTSKTEIILTAQPAAFSPNGDGVQDSIRFTPVVKAGSAVKQYMLRIIDAQGSVVWSAGENRALPSVFTWNGLASDGTRCADGTYTAILETTAANGAQAKTSAPAFVIDTQSPSVTVQVPYLVFSPDKDGNKDTLPVTVTSTSEDKWTGSITSDKGVTVRSYTWQGTIPSFEWDGTDEAGNTVADGSYRLSFAAQDAAGNKASAQVAGIVVDTRETKAYVTIDLDSISPNGDTYRDVQKFTLRTSLTDGIANWNFSIVTADGGVVRSWSDADSKTIPAVINWDGRGADGTVTEGAFTGILSLTYTKGNAVTARSGAFICSVTPPALSVRTSPKYFSPDNDGVDDDLFIELKGTSAVPLKNWSFAVNDPENGHTFWSINGKSAITERVIWDGRGNNGELVQSAMDYPYIFTATDELGMTSVVQGKISVDVLVIRVGDVLKMQVPSIIFRSNNADFKNADEVAKGPAADRMNQGLDQSIIDNNIRVLKRIAEILNKFKDYTVTIEGHANNVSGTESEETSTANGNIPLVPLSQKRAEFVRSKLVEYGVDSARLAAVGRGGRSPVVLRSDKDNWWKNRRVEFILNK
jgi:flagellar hook assembly protein FlgD